MKLERSSRTLVLTMVVAVMSSCGFMRRALVGGAPARYTRIGESREMFARARSPKGFWEVEGAAHVDLHRFAPAEYERRVGTFLERNLTKAPEHRPRLGPRSPCGKADN